MEPSGAIYGPETQREHGPYAVLVRPAIQSEAEAAHWGGSLAEQNANAELIVRAVNAHDDLYAACRRLADRLETAHTEIEILREEAEREVASLDEAADEADVQAIAEARALLAKADGK